MLRRASLRGGGWCAALERRAVEDVDRRQAAADVDAVGDAARDRVAAQRERVQPREVCERAQSIASLDEIVGGVHNLERAEMLEAGKRDELIVRHVEVDEASQRRERAAEARKQIVREVELCERRREPLEVLDGGNLVARERKRRERREGAEDVVDERGSDALDGHRVLQV